MKIIFLVAGKTRDAYLLEGIRLYEEKIHRYISYEYICLPELKGSLSPEQQIAAEEKQILSKVDVDWHLWLLDEKGKTFTSEEFAGFLQSSMNQSTKTICFVCGGPYGFSNQLRNKSKGSVSLSKMTFTHQMVRLFFVEQLYRAFTILHGSKYHH
ncbi:MAG: 23S rRNA (pseudouridine(1915)-N(3))-methyltransferase RlmH [Bacteroidota bacterium]|jgi:23S rRNA (pseudouridine1915-N3)-methyltransferase